MVFHNASDADVLAITHVRLSVRHFDFAGGRFVMAITIRVDPSTREVEGSAREA